MASGVFYPAASTDTGYWFINGGWFQPSGYNGRTAAAGNYNGNSEGAWARFQNVAIPPGATITSAFLRLTSNNSAATSSTVSLAVRAELADSPPAPTSITDANSRIKSDGVSWFPGDWTAQAYDSPDIASAIQEVVDRAGWEAGNALQIFVLDSGSSFGAERAFYCFGNGTGYPELHVTWAEGVEIPTDDIAVAAPSPSVRHIVIPTNTLTVSSPPVSIGDIRLDFIVRHLIPVGRDLMARHLAPGVLADFAAAHSVAGWVWRGFTAAHAVPALVARAFRARHAVLDINPASRQWTSRHGIPADTAIFRPASWSAVFDDDGSLLDLSGATITGDRESYAWSVDLTLPDAEAWADCTPGRRLTLTVSGMPFALVLEGRTRDRAATSAEWTATARTVSCLLGEPYADSLTQSWPEITASQAAAELAALAGLPCAWEVCDWILPAGRLTADAETPAAVLSRLAQSCGGMLQPAPAGGVRVVYRYPVGVTEYASATPRASLTAADAVLTLSETYSAQPGYDAVTVADNRAASDAYLTWELDSDRNAGRDTFPPGEPCYLRVYHEVDYAVRATSGTLERIAVDEEESLTETVGFDDEDAADLNKLVAAVDAVVWWGADLGAVVPNGGGSVLLSGGAGFSVAEITYRTRYDVWKLMPAALGEAFPVMLELAEADT